MTNPYIVKEVTKIFNEDNKNSLSQKAALAAAWTAAHFKASNIKIFDVNETSSLSSYYIICDTENTIQARTIAEEIVPIFKKHDFYPISIEGLDDGDWVLLDLGDIMLHIFQEHTRDVYALDELWNKHPQIDIPHSYFTGSDAEGEKLDEISEEEKSYF